MSSHIYAVDDKDLDDAALWAVIDSAAAASISSAAAAAAVTVRARTKPLTPIPFPLNSPQPKFPNNTRGHRHNYNNHKPDGEVVLNPRPQKISRTVNTPRVISENSLPQLMMVKHVHQTPPACIAGSPEAMDSAVTSFHGPMAPLASREKMDTRHCLSGQFPSVSLFKDYQNAAMEILEKNDYTMISGSPYIKKSGWRKISFYFNLSYEIKDKTIEYDENRNVQHAEFIVRAYMQGGRFSDGWGSCERREKRFQKPNHDIPSTAETRAKNRACQDLLGIGEYRPGAKHSHG